MPSSLCIPEATPLAALGAPNRTYAWVYFIREEGTGLFKIGSTVNSPFDRLMAMQVGNARRLSIVGVFLGKRVLEKRMHKRLAAYRIGGEWFLPEDRVRSEVRLFCLLGRMQRLTMFYDPPIKTWWPRWIRRAAKIGLHYPMAL